MPTTFNKSSSSQVGSHPEARFTRVGIDSDLDCPKLTAAIYDLREIPDPCIMPPIPKSYISHKGSSRKRDDPASPAKCEEWNASHPLARPSKTPQTPSHQHRHATSSEHLVSPMSSAVGLARHDSPVTNIVSLGWHFIDDDNDEVGKKNTEPTPFPSFPSLQYAPPTVKPTKLPGPLRRTPKHYRFPTFNPEDANPQRSESDDQCPRSASNPTNVYRSVREIYDIGPLGEGLDIWAGIQQNRKGKHASPQHNPQQQHHLRPQRKESKQFPPPPPPPPILTSKSSHSLPRFSFGSIRGSSIFSSDGGSSNSSICRPESQRSWNGSDLDKVKCSPSWQHDHEVPITRSSSLQCEASSIEDKNEDMVVDRIQPLPPVPQLQPAPRSRHEMIREQSRGMLPPPPPPKFTEPAYRGKEVRRKPLVCSKQFASPPPPPPPPPPRPPSCPNQTCHSPTEPNVPKCQPSHIHQAPKHKNKRKGRGCFGILLSIFITPRHRPSKQTPTNKTTAKKQAALKSQISHPGPMVAPTAVTCNIAAESGGVGGPAAAISLPIHTNGTPMKKYHQQNQERTPARETKKQKHPIYRGPLRSYRSSNDLQTNYIHIGSDIAPSISASNTYLKLSIPRTAPLTDDWGASVNASLNARVSETRSSFVCRGIDVDGAPPPPPLQDNRIQHSKSYSYLSLDAMQHPSCLQPTRAPPAIPRGKGELVGVDDRLVPSPLFSSSASSATTAIGTAQATNKKSAVPEQFQVAAPAPSSKSTSNMDRRITPIAIRRSRHELTNEQKVDNTYMQTAK